MNHTHQVAALGAIATGTALAVAGVFVLAGIGWALIAAALPCFGLVGMIQKGLRNG